jgi:WhiB family redox-sensing transcriptional regulator
MYIELTSQIVSLGGVPCESVPDAFFIDQGDANSVQKGKLARKLCSECPVRLLCLEYALESNEDEGMWGGLSSPERFKLRKRRVASEGVYSDSFRR